MLESRFTEHLRWVLLIQNIFKTLERHVRNCVWRNCKWREKKLDLILFAIFEGGPKINNLNKDLHLQQTFFSRSFFCKHVIEYCMLLSCHVRVSEWIYTLYLPEFQGNPSWKQAGYLKVKWQQRDRNPQPLSS